MNDKKQMTMNEIEKALGHKVQIIDRQIVKLHDVLPGDSFSFLGIEFIVLEQSNVGTHVIKKDIYESSLFDPSTNNFIGSQIEQKIKHFERLIKNKCKENQIDFDSAIIDMSTSLTSLDGRTDYGYATCKVSLLSLLQYREHVHILDLYKLKDAWFLCTPASTASNGCHELICCINNKNYVDFASIRSTCGIRPSMLLNQTMTVEVSKIIK